MANQQRTICDGCLTEITPWTAMMNARLGPLDHTKLDLCDACRDRLTVVLGVQPRREQGQAYPL